MKLRKYVLALVALVSSAAFACPDLTGVYTCIYDGDSETLNFTQEVRDGVTYYNLGGEELAADNQARPLPDDDFLKGGTLRGWCEGDVLKGEVLGKAYDGDEFFGDFALQVSFSLDAEKNLEQVSTGTIKSEDQTHPLDDEITCTRNP